MREGADAHDVAVVLARDGRDLDDVPHHLRLGDGAETVSFIGDLAVGHAVGERRADDGIFVEPDRGLQRAADQHDGEKPGQHRARQPADADAAAIRRPVLQVARVERSLVAEVDERPLQTLFLESCQTRSRPPVREAPYELSAGRKTLAAS